MSNEIRSYGKVWAFGHREASMLVGTEVVIQEKVDGSQFSARRIGDDLFCRSKSVALIDGAIPDLFQPSVEHLRGVLGEMREGVTYRFEAMARPRHNTLTYSRVPRGHLVLFDVDADNECYEDHGSIVMEASRLGVEPIPLLDTCYLRSPDDLTKWLDRESFLGGALVEGVVCKPVVPIYGADKKRIAAKLVSEAFKETHSKEWIPDKAQKTEIERRIADAIGTPARFAKAVARLRERDAWTGTVKDIGGLIGEVAKDIDEECRGLIEEMLYAEYRKTITRLVTGRVPEWYKRHLVAEAFNSEAAQ